MIRVALILPALLMAVPVAAASDLNVLPQGRYGCWTSGSAVGPAVNELPEHRFTIVRGSSYASAAGHGTYLVASDILTFTRGPLKDMRLRRSKQGFWQLLARDGELEALKCNRIGPAKPA